MAFTKEGIIKLLSDPEHSFSPEDVEKFASYCLRLSLEKDSKTKELKNPWINKKSDQDLATLFKRVAAEKLVFDGVNITLQSTGVSYNYVAYKNKMLIIYPETVMDYSLVYKNDKTKFGKESGKVTYTHDIADPFDRKDEDITGAYCVIKNRRGEFLTTLSKPDIDKHRKVAKTDYIWKAWFAEMCTKTIVKKACATHFRDEFQNIENMDNENYDLSRVSEESIREKASKETHPDNSLDNILK